MNTDYKLTVTNLCTLYDSKKSDTGTLAVYKGREFVCIPNQLCLQKFWYFFLEYGLNLVDHDVQSLTKILARQIKEKGFKHYFEEILNIGN